MRTVLRSSAVDPDRTWSPAELETYVAQWSEPDRAAASVAVYRSFLTRELRDLAAGGFDDRVLETPCVQFVGIADPVVRPDQQRGCEANAPRLRLEVVPDAGHWQVVPDAGHWLPEEAPEALLGPMLDLYAGPASPTA
jgi:pimeloyl-ACP methyl ester carboxylesterase